MQELCCLPPGNYSKLSACPCKIVTNPICACRPVWCCAEALLSAILLPTQPQAVPTPAPSSDPWSNGSVGFGVPGLVSGVLRPQPDFGDLQQAANQMQQLLMAGHRLEALRQAMPYCHIAAAILPYCHIAAAILPYCHIAAD